MTRDEAVECIIGACVVEMGKMDAQKELIEAYIMAIEALQQEPTSCERCGKERGE